MILPESYRRLPDIQNQQAHTSLDDQARRDVLDVPAHHEMIVIIRSSFMMICGQDA